jgi:hypothetical protein
MYSSYRIVHSFHSFVEIGLDNGRKRIDNYNYFSTVTPVFCPTECCLCQREEDEGHSSVVRTIFFITTLDYVFLLKMWLTY